MLSVALLLCGALLFLSSQMPAAEAHNLPDMQQLLDSTGVYRQHMNITEDQNSLIKEIQEIYEEHDKTLDDEHHEDDDHAEELERLGKLTAELKEAVKNNPA